MAIGLRGLNAWRPVDGSIWNASREANVAAMARNFDREGMNILHPRIDWRGDGPGYVEAEFPLLPWLGAALYRLVGYREEFLRLIALAAAAGSCWVFWRLADRLLGQWPAVCGFAFFAFQPLVVVSASWIQPEPLMLLAYLAAIDQFDRWTDTGGWHRYVTAGLATSLAILIKLPAAHLGLLFALIALRKFGRQALWRADLWILAVFILLPPAMWYAHARALWLEHGNSLGVSDEALVPISQWDFLKALPSTVRGLVSIEALFVWTPPGLLFALPAMRRAWRKCGGAAEKLSPSYLPPGDSPARNGPEAESSASAGSRNPTSNGSVEGPLLVEWGLALVVFYVVTGCTTGEWWAYYYHVVSVPLVALAVGMSCRFVFDALATRPVDRFAIPGEVRQMWIAIAVIAAIYAVLGWTIHYLVEDLPLRQAAVSIAGLVGGAVLLYLDRRARIADDPSVTSLQSARFRVWLVGLLTAASLTVGWDVAETRRYLQGKAAVFSRYDAALHMEPHLRGSGPVAIAGAGRRDAYTPPGADKAPYFFYWLDRQGFAVSAEDVNVPALEELHERGVRFFIVEREVLEESLLLESALRRRFRVVDDHAAAVLFDLASNPPRPPGLPRAP